MTEHPCSRAVRSRCSVDLGVGPAPARTLPSPSHHWAATIGSRSRVLATSVLSTALLWSLTAHSLPPLPMTLDQLLSQTQHVCGESREAREFMAALDAEASTVSWTQPATIRTLACDAADGTLTVWLVDQEIILDVTDVPRTAKARTLAVAFVETLRMPTHAPTVATTSSIPNDPTPSAAINHEPTPVRQPVPPALDSPLAAMSVEPEHDALQLAVTLRAQVVGPRATLALGPTLGVALPVLSWLQLGVHLGYLTSHHRSALGQARLHAATFEGDVAVTVWRPSRATTLDLGASIAAINANVVVESAWGLTEPNVHTWFGQWSIHARAATTLSAHTRIFTQLAVLKEVVGLRLRAGGEQAMSFYGLGAELRVGASYAW